MRPLPSSKGCTVRNHKCPCFYVCSCLSRKERCALSGRSITLIPTWWSVSISEDRGKVAGKDSFKEKATVDEIYFDNAATTRPTPEAVCALTNALVGEYGNASSIHARGKAAKQVLEDARAIVAEALGVDAEEIYFTSGATEANNLALYGAAGAAGPDAGAVVVSALEHPSVTKTVRGLR
ncbi:MAG: aminotransferase class V-fold PLP-dependent enzyme, partial [Eggerthellaceae bacterium]|nr:aminotransferase class V-fold PLP-dependent enzyme [Eggerthellaceae bacterium]